MKILITGAAGFIGTYLSKELRIAGHDVMGIDRKDGDLTKPGVAGRLIKDHKPKVLVHLAAKVGRLFGEENPQETIDINSVATIYVARACAKLGVRMVYVSTSEAFGDSGERDVDESERGVLPYNLYGLSKRWGEEASQLYAPDGLQILRLSMPYGPGLPAGWGRAAVITFLWQAHYKKHLTVHRGGRRRLCWVGDMVNGMRMIIENGGMGVWTVGRDDNDEAMSVVAKKACSIAKAPLSLIQEVDPPQNQTLVKRLNIKRLKNLGWSPKVGLLDGMVRSFKMVKQYDDKGMPPEGWRKIIQTEVEL